MISGSETTPIPEHDPALVEHYYEHGGWQMTPDEARSYARSADAFNGAMCAACQAAQGGHLSWYSRSMRDRYGLNP
jgi:hypothetical protein